MDALRTFVLLAAGQLVVLSAFVHGLQLEPGTIRTQLRRPVAWRAIGLVIFVLPLVAIAVARTLPLSPLAAGTLVLMACCPGQEAQVFAASRQGGNPRLSIALAVTLSLVSIVTVPAWMTVIDRLTPAPWDASPGLVFSHVAPRLLAPLAAGFTLRALVPSHALALARWGERLLVAGLALAAVLLVVVGGRELAHARPVSLLAAAAMLGTSALLGHLAGGPDPHDRTTVGIAALFGNPAVALAVAEANRPEIRLAPALAAYVLLRVLATLAFTGWARRHAEGIRGG
jgi:BASS family bile acid:Na+ symporter